MSPLIIYFHHFFVEGPVRYIIVPTLWNTSENKAMKWLFRKLGLCIDVKLLKS